MLAAVLDPAHRMIEFERQCGEDDLFRVEPRLGSEAAADIGCDDADATQFDAEKLAQGNAHGMRRLRRGVDHDLVEPVVAIGEHGAAFERSARLPVHTVFAGHGDLGGARRGVDIAAFEHPLAIEVVAPLLVNGVTAAAHVARRVDDGVEHLEID